MDMVTEMYRSQISNKKWMAYDIPGNVGWITFLAGLVLCAVKRSEILENGVIFALLVLDALCGLAMAADIAGLILREYKKMA
ncbi:MAG: hypothetical protein NC041_10090 [Bacteroides sp.]|nr:hypothetical protein [Prevotella sp.]MCM1470802.1 hypothetical protein [Bacteroides sp.]